MLICGNGKGIKKAMTDIEADSGVTVPEARLLKKMLQDKLQEIFEDFTNQTGLLIVYVNVDVDKEDREYLKVRVDAEL